jgi:hypothetical protein
VSARAAMSRVAAVLVALAGLTACGSLPARDPNLSAAAVEQGPRTAVVKPSELSVEELVAIESALPPAGDALGERLDAAHDELYIWLQETFQSFDRRFVDDAERPAPVPASPFRIGLGLEGIDRRDGLDTDLDTEFDVTLRLPNMERRLKVFLTTEDLSEISETADSGVSSVRAGVRLDALRWFDFELGAKLDLPPVAFAALRWSKRWRSGRWDLQPYAKLFAETDDGVGASAALIVNHWRGRTLARSVTSAKWLNDRDATEWSQSLSLARVDALLEPDQYSARLRGQDLARAWGVRAQVGGYEASTVDYYELGPFYKRPLHSDWLYLSVQPVVRWEREFDWRADPGLRIGFEALFWGLSRAR